MSEKTFISFSDFKDKILNTPVKHEQTTEEMMAMAKVLNAAFGGTVVEV